MSAPTTVQWLRAAVHRIAVGSGRRATSIAAWAARRGRGIWSGARAWLDEGTGLGWLLRLALLVIAAAAARKVATAVGLAVYHRAAAGRAPFLCWGLAAWWIVSAYRAGADGWEPKQQPQQPTDQETSEQPAEADAEDEDPAPPPGPPPAGPPLPNLLDLRTALARVGTPHAHIAALASDIGTTPERVREALDRWDIPVEPVRMQGRGSSTGVKGGAAVHPALAPGQDVTDVVAAGQTANNDNNNADSSPAREEVRVQAIGEGGRLVHDPAEAVRRHTSIPD
ncbi:hypothetical protein [Streptomyces sp. NPDC001914]|uniref:hypothetical protein n=1 Tax=Streptomyces sp. NPDC001914 TaxID=3364623 RepID=UPI0036A0F81D